MILRGILAARDHRALNSSGFCGQVRGFQMGALGVGGFSQVVEGLALGILRQKRISAAHWQMAGARRHMLTFFCCLVLRHVVGLVSWAVNFYSFVHTRFEFYHFQCVY